MQEREIHEMSDGELHLMYENDFCKATQSQILAKSIMDGRSVPDTLRNLALKGAKSRRPTARFRIVK